MNIPTHCTCRNVDGFELWTCWQNCWQVYGCHIVKGLETELSLWRYLDSLIVEIIALFCCIKYNPSLRDLQFC